MDLNIEYSREKDGRWCARVLGLEAETTLLGHGDSQADARRNAQAAALFTLANSLEQGIVEAVSEVRFTDGEVRAALNSVMDDYREVLRELAGR